jgi:hypothetical protein
MGWLSRLRGPTYVQVGPIADVAAGLVELVGVVESLDEIVSPLTGDRGVALRYEASMPSATRAVFGELPGNILRLRTECSQAVDFLLRDDSGAVLVRVAAGRDVAAVHAEMVDRHGLELDARAEIIGTGERVRVRGRVVDVCRGSPHRRERWDAVVRADSVEAEN